jgi:hypothetical protein
VANEAILCPAGTDGYAAGNSHPGGLADTGHSEGVGGAVRRLEGVERACDAGSVEGTGGSRGNVQGAGRGDGRELNGAGGDVTAPACPPALCAARSVILRSKVENAAEAVGSSPGVDLEEAVLLCVADAEGAAGVLAGNMAPAASSELYFPSKGNTDGSNCSLGSAAVGCAVVEGSSGWVGSCANASRSAENSANFNGSIVKRPFGGTT